MLKPGGFLIGDDYDGNWPSVQQSLNEFVLFRAADAFVPPWRTASEWASSGLHAGDFAAVELHDLQSNALLSPILLKGRQWMLLKPARHDAASRGHYQPVLATPLPRLLAGKMRCCVNGWNDGYAKGKGDGKACAPMLAELGQETCAEQGGESPADCRQHFACRWSPTPHAPTSK